MSEPTPKRVEAYEKALGCEVVHTRFYARCVSHGASEGQTLGCPVAVAAARVEAERVAEVEARIERIEDGWRRTNTECIKHWNRADAAEAVIEKVRALAETRGAYSAVACEVLTLLPEPVA
jgi:hypothetical protein